MMPHFIFNVFRGFSVLILVLLVVAAKLKHPLNFYGKNQIWLIRSFSTFIATSITSRI